MAVSTTNLGVVTAYGYAKQKGYTGTETEFAQLMADYAEIAVLTENFPDIIANEYSSSSTYEVGDFVLYDGLLYMCNTDISSGESWNTNHWDLVTLTDAMKASQVICTDSNSDGNIVISVSS